MVVQFVPGQDDHAAIMVCTGHVCLQWSLLENNLMMVLCACQNVSIDEAAILFGGLDMKPRLNMAINLARFHKWSPPLQKRLKDLRAVIDKAKLIDRRNLIVHGVHSNSEIPTKTVNLYTPRRSGSAQREDWSVQDAYQLGNEICAAATAAWNIFDAYGRWKFGDHFVENGGSEVVATPLSAFARFKQYLRTRLNHLIG